MVIYSFQRFQWYAVVILYADGSTDAILIEQLIHHIDYFRILKKSSERVFEVCKDLKMNFSDLAIILKRLASQNAYVFLNFNIREILSDFSYVYQNLPGFKVFGSHCESDEQFSFLNEIVCNYDLRQIGVQLLRGEDFQYINHSWIDPIGTKNYIGAEKQRLLKKEEDKNDKY